MSTQYNLELIRHDIPTEAVGILPAIVGVLTVTTPMFNPDSRMMDNDKEIFHHAFALDECTDLAIETHAGIKPEVLAQLLQCHCSAFLADKTILKANYPLHPHQANAE